MIVPPQAVMLTAHVGDSLRCLIAKSRQAGVTRPALHKGPGGMARLDIVFGAAPDATTNDDDDVNNDNNDQRLLCSDDDDDKNDHNDITTFTVTTIQSAHDSTRKLTLCCFSIVPIDSLGAGGGGGCRHHTLERTHARTNPESARIKTR